MIPKPPPAPPPSPAPVHAPGIEGRILAAIVLLGLVIRFAVLQWELASPFFDAPFLDELYYRQWAMDIASGRWLGERAFFRAPLYAYGLGFVFRLAGPDAYLSILLQHLAGTAGIYLVWRAAKRLFPRDGAAPLAAAGLAALYAPAIFFEGQWLDIWLQTLLLPWIFLAAAAAFSNPSPRSFLWLGLAGGIGAIARPAAGPFFVLLVLLRPWIEGRRIGGIMDDPRGEPLPNPEVRGDAPAAPASSAFPRRRFPWRATELGALAAGLALPVLPCALHNYAADRSPTPIATYAGINLWIGNNAAADGYTAQTPVRYFFHGRYEDSVELFARRRAEDLRGRPMSGAEIQSHWLKEALREIALHPVRTAKLLGRKTVLFLTAYEIKNNKNLYFAASFNPILAGLLKVFNFGLILPLGLLGLWVSRPGGIRESTAAAPSGPAGRADPAAWRLHVLLLATLMGGVVLFLFKGRDPKPKTRALLPFAGAGLAALAASFGNLKETMAAKRFPAAAGWNPLFFLVLWAAVNADPLGIRREENSPSRRAEDHWSAANGFRDRGRPEEAEAHYRRAIRLKPGYADALNNLGEILGRRGDLAGARNAFAEAARSARSLEEKVRAWNNLGVAAEQSGDLALAEEHYRRVLAVAPDYAMAWLNLGDVLLTRGGGEEAERAFLRALELQPSMALPELGLARRAASLGNREEASRRARAFIRKGGPGAREAVLKDPVLAGLIGPGSG